MSLSHETRLDAAKEWEQYNMRACVYSAPGVSAYSRVSCNECGQYWDTKGYSPTDEQRAHPRWHKYQRAWA